MSSHPLPRINKLWFYVGDALLVGVAAWVCFRGTAPLTVGMALVCVAAVALGAWLGIAPWIMEYRAATRLAEADQLASTVSQIQNLEAIARQISQATAQWQNVQERSTQTAEAARQIADQIGAEARAFTEVLQKANSGEKAAMRLEVEKLRRAETEWLQVCVRLLDHVFALHQAATRSGQRNLIEQLSQFQNACRDAARRIGLVPFQAEPGALFSDKLHQLPDEHAVVPDNAVVAGTIATGYTFQGQLVRPAIVNLQADGSLTSAPDATVSEGPGQAAVEEEVASGADGQPSEEQRSLI